LIFAADAKAAISLWRTRHEGSILHHFADKKFNLPKLGDAALAAEFFGSLSGSATSRTLRGKRRTALGAESPRFAIVGSALSAAHFSRLLSP
jgi:hypothetical protein